MANTFPFPTTPTNGDTYQLGNTLYIYSSATDEWVGAVGMSSGLTNKQVFIANGTFTIPGGVTAAKVTVVGGGGGGGGGGSYGPGGGGGGAAIKWLTNLTSGRTISVTVGGGGAGGAGGAGGGFVPGTPGGTSAIYSGSQTISIVSATGGAGGGVSANGSGYGGNGSGGDLNILGGPGPAGWQFGSGAGGVSILGGGGTAPTNTGESSAYRDGGQYGGGGAGGLPGGWAGGNGASGVVIFEWVSSTQSSSTGSGLGINQTWQDMTSARVAGNTYTNNTGSPIQVSVMVQNTSAQTSLFVNGSEISKFVGSYVVGLVYTLQAVVPNGSTYKLDLNGGSITGTFKWNELR